MAHPRVKENANRARRMAAHGLIMPPTALKRDREQDISNSFGNIRLADDLETRPTKQSKTVCSKSERIEIADPETPEAEILHGLLQSQKSIDPTTPNKIANWHRLRKAYWTEKVEYSDPFKTPYYNDEMTEDEIKEVKKQAFIATVEDFYRLAWYNYAKHNHNNEPIDPKLVVSRAREHLRIADKCECEIFTPVGLTEYEIKIWNNEVLYWEFNKEEVEESLVVDKPIRYEHPKVPTLDRDSDTQMAESVHRIKRAYKKKDPVKVEVPAWDRDTDNCHWDGKSPRDGSATGAMYWWEIDNSRFPAVPSPAVKPHFAELAADVLRTVYNDVLKDSFAAKSSPKNGVFIPGDEEKEMNMRLGYFPPPDSSAFDGPPPDVGCMPIHDRYSYWLVWLQANGYLAKQFVWLCGKDCESLRLASKLKKPRHRPEGSATPKKEDNFNTTLWMRATRMRVRYMKSENKDGVKKLTRGKGKWSKGKKVKSNSNKNKGKKKVTNKKSHEGGGEEEKKDVEQEEEENEEEEDEEEEDEEEEEEEEEEQEEQEEENEDEELDGNNKVGEERVGNDHQGEGSA